MIEIQASRFPPSWTPPDGLGYSRARQVALTAGGIAMLVVAVAMAAGAIGAGAGLGALAARETKNRRLLEERGVAVDAVVTRLWRGSDEDRQPWLAYGFTFGGRAWSRQIRAPLRAWSQLEPGSALRVRVLPANPSVNHPVAWKMGALPLWVPYLVAAAMASLAMLFVFLLRREWRLLAEGRPAAGVVVRHARADHGKTAMHYEFRLLSGAVAKGKTEGRKPLALGSTLCVMYDPDNPRRNAPYPLQMVRLANARRTVEGPRRHS